MQYNDKQQELLKACNNHAYKYLMAMGGARSGKTWMFCRIILLRALLYPGSKHLICRFNRNRLLDAIWKDTFPKLLVASGLGEAPIEENKSELRMELPNGGVILLRGLDTDDRVEAVLGTEYATIYVNEASEIKKYEVIEKLMTRLNDVSTHYFTGQPIVPKMFFDCNPPVMTHWTYKVFVKGEHPEQQTPLEDFEEEYYSIKINPVDNVQNLGEGYLDTFKNMSEAQKKRFYYGEFTSAEVGKVFCEEWFKYYDINRERRYLYICQSWDTAQKDKEINDPSVGLTWGITEKGEYHLLDCIRLRLKYPDLRSLILQYGQEWGADWVLIEDKSSGQSLLQELPVMDRHRSYIPINPGKDSKVTRAIVCARDFEAGKVFLPKYADWLSGYKEELIEFDDQADYKDRVDATSQFLNWIRMTDIVDLDGEEENYIEELCRVNYNGWKNKEYSWRN